MFDSSQLMKGVLEGCILKIISKETVYGYSIITQLQAHGFDNLREGTTYPILLRLEKKELITAQLRPSPLGPARKYYSITEAGTAYLRQFTESWQHTCHAVDGILKGGDGDENPAPTAKRN